MPGTSCFFRIAADDTSATRGRIPDATQLVDFERIQPDRRARDAGIEALIPRVEVDRQGDIGQAVGGEDLLAGPIREDDESLLAADGRRRCDQPRDADLAPRRVEEDLDAPDLERHDTG